MHHHSPLPSLCSSTLLLSSYQTELKTTGATNSSWHDLMRATVGWWEGGLWWFGESESLKSCDTLVQSAISYRVATKNKTPIPPFLSFILHCYCVNISSCCSVRMRSKWSISSISFYRLRSKGRHPCLLNNPDPHLLTKCSVAHKVFALDKGSGKEGTNYHGATGG